MKTHYFNTNFYGLIGLLFLSLVSCKTEVIDVNSNTLSPTELIEQSLSEMPSIKGGDNEQLRVKKVDVSLKFDQEGVKSEFTLGLDHFEDGKVKSINFPNDLGFNFEYNGNELVVNEEGAITSFSLNEEGLAKSNEKGERFFYKNSFLIYALGQNSRTSEYSEDGNLISWKDSNENSASYTYTEFKNNIRQEIVRSTALHWSFRDIYLGNYSTNLVETIEMYESGEVITLKFDYEFDAKGRVVKMKIDRDFESGLGSAIIEYELSYD